MALHRSFVVRNRLLSALGQDDYALLEPKLERVPLALMSVLIEAHAPIMHVTFPESGIVSVIADKAKGRIEVGVIGREGLVGLPIILGANSTPHTYIVQGDGEGLRIASQDLRAAIQTRPSIFAPLGLYTQSLIVQMGQTIFANSSFDIETRLARWILMTQDRTDSDDLVLTHECAAAMLGVHRPGVTIATQVLEGKGSIRATRGHITVRDRKKLMQQAGPAYQVAENEYDRLLAEA